MIPEIDIWRAASLMLKRYGEKALEESAAHADELFAEQDHDGAAVWRRIIEAIGELAKRSRLASPTDYLESYFAAGSTRLATPALAPTLILITYFIKSKAVDRPRRALVH